MAWRRSGDKPLSAPMMDSLLTHVCVTRPQWVILQISKVKITSEVPIRRWANIYWWRCQSYGQCLRLAWYSEFLNPSGSEVRIYCYNQINIMTADALAPCVAKSTASMILTVRDKYILVFLKKIFQLTARSQFMRNDTEWCKCIFIFPKRYSAWQELNQMYYKPEEPYEIAVSHLFCETPTKRWPDWSSLSQQSDWSTLTAAIVESWMRLIDQYNPHCAAFISRRIKFIYI